MTIGKAGRQPRFFLTVVPCVQRSRRSRRRGDPKTICRHLWQTCTECAISIRDSENLRPEERQPSRDSIDTSRICLAKHCPGACLLLLRLRNFRLCDTTHESVPSAVASATRLLEDIPSS